jgi:hypothetical protein
MKPMSGVSIVILLLLRHFLMKNRFVLAFGVVMWEIESNAAIPYGDVSHCAFFSRFFANQNRSTYNTIGSTDDVDYGGDEGDDRRATPVAADRLSRRAVRPHDALLVARFAGTTLDAGRRRGTHRHCHCSHQATREKIKSSKLFSPRQFSLAMSVAASSAPTTKRRRPQTDKEIAEREEAVRLLFESIEYG